MGNLPSNLVELLRDRVQQHPDRLAFTFLQDGEVEAGQLTYAEVDHQARRIASQMKEWIDPLARVMLVYPYEAGLEFIVAFLGCLYAQVVAVPCHPPRNQNGLLDLYTRLTDSESTAILTTRSFLPKLKRQLQGDSNPAWSLHWLSTDGQPFGGTNQAPDWQMPALSLETPAFLQYTSGSTGQPKGVIVTHDCLWQNQQMLQAAFEHTEATIGLSWLPLFHDMGLIGSVLQALYIGSSSVLMSPIAFVQKPVRWLNAISRYRATTSGAPNFAYDLLCRHVTDSQRDRLDLSSWDVAFCGAEPVREPTIDRFVEKFHACGFRKAAFYPCYGMAEATLFITGGWKAQPPTTLSVDAAALEQNQVIPVQSRSSSTPTISTQTIVSCGRPWLDTQVMIVHPTTGQPCDTHEIGEIWVTGSGISPGYWQQAEQTNHTFRATLPTREGRFLRTGDLGFLHDNELFVTGRLHDVLVFWGFNHYPQQIEQTVEACHPGFRANGCAAFAASIAGEDQLVVAQEVERNYRNRLILSEVVETLRWAIFQNHFLDVGAIVLVKPGGLPRTSSGKIQRSRCRQQFLDGNLAALEEWRASECHDISSLIQHYLNPLTHLHRYKVRFQAQLRRYLGGTSVRS